MRQKNVSTAGIALLLFAYTSVKSQAYVPKCAIMEQTINSEQFDKFLKSNLIKPDSLTIVDTFNRYLKCIETIVYNNSKINISTVWEGRKKNKIVIITGRDKKKYAISYWYPYTGSSITFNYKKSCGKLKLMNTGIGDF